MKEKKAIILRADGNSQIGLGHIYRLLALAEILQGKFKCTFIVNTSDELILGEIKKNCSRCLNLHGITKARSKIPSGGIACDLEEYINGDEIVVIDGYHFGASYQRLIKERGCKLVCVDDIAEGTFYADIVINHGDPRIENKYLVQHYTKLLLGLQYLILRNCFLTAARKSRVVTEVKTVFVCMGGSDPFNITFKVLQACMECDFIGNIIVVTGSAYQYGGQLKSFIKEVKEKRKINYKENISGEQMLSLLEQCEIAVCTASSISLEVCCARRGLLVGTVVNNQENTDKYLQETGCCYSLGNLREATLEEIRDVLKKLDNVDAVNSQIKMQSKAIDGLSGQRLLHEFKMLANA